MCRVISEAIGSVEKAKSVKSDKFLLRRSTYLTEIFMIFPLSPPALSALIGVIASSAEYCDEMAVFCGSRRERDPTAVIKMISKPLS
jgi:hypothetical protein